MLLNFCSPSAGSLEIFILRSICIFSWEQWEKFPFPFAAGGLSTAVPEYVPLPQASD